MRDTIVAAKYLGIVVLCSLVTRSAWAQTPITACGTNITAAGSYVVSGALHCPNNTAPCICISVNASNVDLDLNNQTISGPSGENGSSSAIVIGTTAQDCSLSDAAISNVRIHNGTIENFTQAIVACETSYSIFDHITVMGAADGIVLQDHSDNNFVLANPISSCNIGIQIGASTDGSDTDMKNSLEGNQISLCGTAVTSSDLLVKTAGILLYGGAQGTQVTANTVTGGWLNGIELRRCASPVGQPVCNAGPSGNFLQQNVVTTAGTGAGINVSDSAGNRIQDNSSEGNAHSNQNQQADVLDDNNDSRRRPCANTWTDNFYASRIAAARCIPGSVRNSVSPK
jgi:hypothetical protein